MSLEIRNPGAEIIDLAEFRALRAARQRAASGFRRQFLWKWPLSGQFVAAEFPWSAAALSSRQLQAR